MSFWYSDTVVKEHRVQTGYRLMLVYNLVPSELGITLSAACLNDSQQNLNDVLGKLEQEIASHPGQAPRNLVYLLQPALGDSDLRLDFPRGKDHPKARHLMKACRTRNFCFFLATMEYTITWYLDEYDCDGNHCPCCLQNAKDVHAWDNCDERSCSLSAILTANGKRIAKNIKTDELSVIQNQVVGPNAEPDEYRLAGRTLGEGGLNDDESDDGPYQRGLVHVYHCKSVVLVPRTFRFDFLMNGKSPKRLDFDVWVHILLREIEDKSLCMASKGELKNFCRCIVPRERPLSKRRRTENRGSYDMRAHASMPELVLPQELAALIGQCEDLSFDSEVQSLMRTILKECAT